MASRLEHLAEGVTLHCGDCREILPTLGKVDAVVTDPPYGIDYGRQGSFSASHGWGPWRENVAWDMQRPERSIFEAILACSKHQIIWGGNYFTDYLPPTMQWFIWDKGQRNFSLADFEIAWSSQEKASRIIMIPRAVARLDGKEHPTQKPLQLMSWCIERLPPPCGANSRSVHGLRHHRRRRREDGSQVHWYRDRAKLLRHCVQTHRLSHSLSRHVRRKAAHRHQTCRIAVGGIT